MLGSARRGVIFFVCVPSLGSLPVVALQVLKKGENASSCCVGVLTSYCVGVLASCSRLAREFFASEQVGPALDISKFFPPSVWFDVLSRALTAFASLPPVNALVDVDALA